MYFHWLLCLYFKFGTFHGNSCWKLNLVSDVTSFIFPTLGWLSKFSKILSKSVLFLEFSGFHAGIFYDFVIFVNTLPLIVLRVNSFKSKFLFIIKIFFREKGFGQFPKIFRFICSVFCYLVFSERSVSFFKLFLSCLISSFTVVFFLLYF